MKLIFVLHIITIIDNDLTSHSMLLQNFDMNLLVVLNALLEERNVTATGKRLGRTQSAISNSLKKLRQALHDPLLVRGPYGLVLTPKAVSLQPQVREMLAIAQEFLAKPGPFDPATATGSFRISGPDRLTMPVMLPLLKSLRRTAPGVSLELVNTGRETALLRLDEDRIDVSVGWYEAPPPRFNASLLFTDYLRCVAHSAHPIMKTNGPLTFESVLSYPHLVISAADEPREAFDAILSRRRLNREVGVRLPNFAAAAGLLQESELVGVFARRIADSLAREPGLSARSLPTDIATFDHYLVWHRRHDEDPRHEWLRDQVHAAFADDA